MKNLFLTLIFFTSVATIVSCNSTGLDKNHEVSDGLNYDSIPKEGSNSIVKGNLASKKVDSLLFKTIVNQLPRLHLPGRIVPDSESDSLSVNFDNLIQLDLQQQRLLKLVDEDEGYNFYAVNYYEQDELMFILYTIDYDWSFDEEELYEESDVLNEVIWVMYNKNFEIIHKITLQQQGVTESFYSIISPQNKILRISGGEMENIYQKFTEYKWGENGFELIHEGKQVEFKGSQEGYDKSIENVQRKVEAFLK